MISNTNKKPQVHLSLFNLYLCLNVPTFIRLKKKVIMGTRGRRKLIYIENLYPEYFTQSSLWINNHSAIWIGFRGSVFRTYVSLSYIFNQLPGQLKVGQQPAEAPWFTPSWTLIFQQASPGLFVLMKRSWSSKPHHAGFFEVSSYVTIAIVPLAQSSNTARQDPPTLQECGHREGKNLWQFLQLQTVWDVKFCSPTLQCLKERSHSERRTMLETSYASF